MQKLKRWVVPFEYKRGKGLPTDSCRAVVSIVANNSYDVPKCVIEKRSMDALGNIIWLPSREAEDSQTMLEVLYTVLEKTNAFLYEARKDTEDNG